MKKQIILLILNELNINSDKHHPKTQTEIAKKLSGEQFKFDRKTVARNIKFLQEMGYPIVKTNAGFYMDYKCFSADELKFVREAIISADGKPDDEKVELADKVERELSRLYRR